MKLIVGLGNPGKEYEKTRHNIGFRYIDYFAKKNNCEISNNKFNGLYGTLMINGEKVILLKPQSYMNLSGEVVRKFVDYFNIKIEDILIIEVGNGMRDANDSLYVTDPEYDYPDMSEVGGGVDDDDFEIIEDE